MKGSALVFMLFFLHMNHRQKKSFNLCVTISICTTIYEGSQNTCNPQKIFQHGPVLWPTHEAQRWHSWNFPKWLLAGAGKGHLTLWASEPEWWRAPLSDRLSCTSERYKYSAPLKNKQTAIQIAQVLYRKQAKSAEKWNSECIEGQLMW